MAKGRASSSVGLDPLHDRAGLVEERRLAVGGDEEGHPAARHPAEHQEAPEVLAERLPSPRRMIDSVNRLLTQGMIPLIGPSQFRVVRPPSASDVGRLRPPRRSPRRSASASPRPSHSALLRRRYFSVTMFRIGPTFWAIPPWTRTRLSARARVEVGGARRAVGRRRGSRGSAGAGPG